MNLFDYDTTVKLLVRKYPTLYWGETFERMKFKVSDHMFNTIGNGFSDESDFKSIAKTKENIDLLNNKELDFIFSAQPIMSVYDKRKPFSERGDLIVLKGYELKDGENSYDIEDYEKCYYPNFEKRYSFFYKIDENVRDKLDITWFEAMKEFYNEAREHLNGDGKYRRKPSEDDDWLSFVNDMTDVINNLKKDLSEEEGNKKVSEHYSGDFDGNVEKFLKEAWKRDLKKINSFINEILIDIDDEIMQRMEIQQKRKKICRIRK